MRKLSLLATFNRWENWWSKWFGSLAGGTWLPVISSEPVRTRVEGNPRCLLAVLSCPGSLHFPAHLGVIRALRAHPGYVWNPALPMSYRAVLGPACLASSHPLWNPSLTLPSPLLTLADPDWPHWPWPGHSQQPPYMHPVWDVWFVQNEKALLLFKL